MGDVAAFMDFGGRRRSLVGALGKIPLAAHVTCYRGPEGTCYRGPFDVLSRTFPQTKPMTGKGKIQPETLKLLYYVES